MLSALTNVLIATTLEATQATGSIDAIVVGSGAAGGLAALLLTEAGLRVLVLEAGPSRGQGSFSRWLTTNASRLLTGRPLDLLPRPLDSMRKGLLRTVGRWRQPIQIRCDQWSRAPEAFVDDLDCPYVTPPDCPFVWVRARGLGGRMLVPDHGWQYYRLGPDDIAPIDGLSPAWPVKVDELNHWYAVVERRLRLAGERDGLPWLPDSELSYSLEPTENQRALQLAIKARWPDARAVVGRFAPPLDGLGAAAMTGRLLCRQGAIAREILVDASGRAHGIAWIDQQSGRTERAYAPLIFVCASSLESTRLLLLSRAAQGRHGLGAASGVLGCYLMDHIKLIARGLAARLAPGADRQLGRCLYLPRFDARALSEPRGRGFSVQVYQSSLSLRSVFFAVSFGEMTPRKENRVMLDPCLKDAWNIPILRIECRYNRPELRRASQQATGLRELAETARVRFASVSAPAPPGSACHECGTARMGTDPGDSVLDPYNECWNARGLYVTDAASFPSQGAANPTLTILALTARACEHAIRTSRG